MNTSCTQSFFITWDVMFLTLEMSLTCPYYSFPSILMMNSAGVKHFLCDPTCYLLVDPKKSITQLWIQDEQGYLEKPHWFLSLKVVLVKHCPKQSQYESKFCLLLRFGLSYLGEFWAHWASSLSWDCRTWAWRWKLAWLDGLSYKIFSTLKVVYLNFLPNIFIIYM